MNLEPQWQPISMLPVFTEMVDGMLHESVVQLNNLTQIKDKPHILDDETLQRIFKLYTDQLEDHWLFTQQFKRWLSEDITPQERHEVERLNQQSQKLEQTNKQILELARSFEHATIDKIMEMKDGELTVAMMTGEIKPPY